MIFSNCINILLLENIQNEKSFSHLQHKNGIMKKIILSAMAIVIYTANAAQHGGSVVVEIKSITCQLGVSRKYFYKKSSSFETLCWKKYPKILQRKLPASGTNYCLILKCQNLYYKK